MGILVEDRIEGVKRRGYIPVSQGTESDTSLIERINDELFLTIVPAIERVKENYFLTQAPVTSITASKSIYKIPTRASGTALKDVWYLDQSQNRVRPISRTDVHRLSQYQTTGSFPVEMLVKGDSVVIYPTPSDTIGYLEFWYYMRPNRLIATSSCAKITAVSSASGTTTLTVDTDLTASLSIGSLIDFISQYSPFSLHAYDVAITAISSTQIQVATANIDDEISAVLPVVGDYIAPARYSPIAQVPEEFFPALDQATAMRTLESLGDLQKRQAARETFGELMASAISLIVNRIEGEPELVKNRNNIVSSMGSYWSGWQTWR